MRFHPERWRWLLLAAASVLSPGVSSSEVGDAAPSFRLAGSDGNTHALADYRGRHVVLAFFPKAFTGG